MTTLGIVAAVKAAIEEDSDHWTLWLAGDSICGLCSEWAYTPNYALQRRQRPDEIDAWEMYYATKLPEVSPRKRIREMNLPLTTEESILVSDMIAEEIDGLQDALAELDGTNAPMSRVLQSRMDQFHALARKVRLVRETQA
jgi:hypothetical protein